MTMLYRHQASLWRQGKEAAGAGCEVVAPNRKLKLMDQVREVMHLKHDVSTTMVHTRILKQGGCGLESPPDCL